MAKSPSRRTFLKYLGGAAALSPLLLRSRRAPAATASGRAKYLFLFYSNGTEPTLWSPDGSTESRLVLSEMLSPLEPMRSELVIVENVSSQGTANDHGAPGGLTGQGYSSNTKVSIDQYIAQKLGAGTDIPTLLLGGVSTEQQTAFYRDNQVLSPIFSPTTAYETICGSVGSQTIPKELLLRRRQSAMRLLQAEMAELGGRLAPSQRVGLDLHTASARQTENRLVSGGNAECTGMAPISQQPLLDSATHIEIAVQAFAADLTRVAAVQFGHHQSTQIDMPEIGVVNDWHNGIIHNLGNAADQLIALERWLSGQFLAAADALKATPAPDGNGSLYDQSLMVWARDMGDAVLHNADNMRFVFAGGAGGYLKTAPEGRYIDGGGTGHIRALLNCAEAMGVNDFSGFGGPNGTTETPLSEVCS